MQGIANACREHGIVIDDALCLSGNFSIIGGYDATMTMLTADRPPTAVLALSDEMAFGAIRAARVLGVDVPHDLSIIGIDDHDMSTVIGLTTVHQTVPDHGAHAARVLLNRLSGAAPAPLRINDRVELVVRDTTAPPRR
jgi:DNA-binding LacI/PurR family transcriptional regulator